MQITFRSLLMLVLVMGCLFSTSATTTMHWPDSAFFMFSTGTAISQDAAIESESTIPLESYDITLEPWNQPAWCTNYIDMGEVSLSSLTTPPATGYTDDVAGYVTCNPVFVNHAYWIKTREGEYAKVKVTEATYLGVDPVYGNTNQITFDWVYLGEANSNNNGNSGNNGDDTGSGQSDGSGLDDNGNNSCCLVSSLLLFCTCSIVLLNR